MRSRHNGEIWVLGGSGSRGLLNVRLAVTKSTPGSAATRFAVAADIVAA
jgi:CRISPR/Cas system CSM-associated protein Csm3 (group 7 of RAMP superfamily)